MPSRPFLPFFQALALSASAWITWTAPSNAAAQTPPLAVEVSPEHPLYIFDATALEAPDPLDHASAVIAAWTSLEDELKPFSAVIVDVHAGDAASRFERLRTTLQRLQEAGVPVALRVCRSNVELYPASVMEAVVKEFTAIRVLYVENLTFAEYLPASLLDAIPTVPLIGWLTGTIELAATYNRLCCISLGNLEWARVMSNTWCSPLYDQLAKSNAHVAAIAHTRGHATIANTSAALGLWLEGAAGHWGIGADSRWFEDAGFVSPGVFGAANGPAKMDPSLYRAMVFNGVMTGATVYVFTPSSDLWFGPTKRHWLQTIYPTLVEVRERGLIAPKKLVQEKIRAAYQVSSSGSPQDFHLVMRDLDGVFDRGYLMKGVYGMEKPGQVFELIPNTGRYYWIPVFSPYASQDVVSKYAQVVRPATLNTAEEWAAALDPHYPPQAGQAFVAKIGRAVFIMHTRENLYEEQTFSIPDAPAPVRNFEVSRGENGVTITWARREGDLDYKVFRRVAPETHYELIASELPETTFLDTRAQANETIGYTVTALTSEIELFEGTVNFGEYIALSTVESRIAEEAAVNALLGYGKSEPLPPPEDTRPATQSWWPNADSLPDDQKAIAAEIAQRVEQLEAAFRAENLEETTSIYADAYADPSGWKRDYVRRAFQWFFERYTPAAMQRQIREWDFSTFKDSGEVKLSLYCRFTGWALTDPTGRVADVACHFPQSNEGVVSITFAKPGETWQILRTDPALPNFKEILSYSAGPFDGIVPGPDTFKQP